MKLNGNETIKIKVREKWNDTGFDVSPGEEYLFEAKGRWLDFFLLENAEGSNKMRWCFRIYEKVKKKKLRIENELRGSLIGTIGKNDDTYFVIGKSVHKKISENEEGWLYCFVNDYLGWYWNNFGKISLTITRIK